jgi:hypothetical protein
MMNKSLRGREAESSDKRGYGFRGSSEGMQLALDAKKEPPETGGFES